MTTGVFPISCKSSIVVPLIKKNGLDCEVLKNHRPVSNLSFLSKIIEKIISVRILQHITDNGIIDGFQSAYKAGHSCETALLRVYNDIVITIGKGNGSFLVLIDLSAAFDTIDHDNLFMILEKFVGISGSALQLIKSYFSDRTWCITQDGTRFDIRCAFNYSDNLVIINQVSPVTIQNKNHLEIIQIRTQIKLVI